VIASALLRPFTRSPLLLIYGILSLTAFFSMWMSIVNDVFDTGDTLMMAGISMCGVHLLDSFLADDADLLNLPLLDLGQGDFQSSFMESRRGLLDIYYFRQIDRLTELGECALTDLRLLVSRRSLSLPCRADRELIAQ